MALAVSQIISRSSNVEGQERVLDTIDAWRNRQQSNSSQQNHYFPQSHSLEETSICALTEQRLKLMIAVKQKAIEESKRKKSRKQVGAEENEYSDLDGSDAEDESDDKKSNPTCDDLSASKQPTLEIESDISWNDSAASPYVLPSKPKTCDAEVQKVVITNDIDIGGSEDEDEWW
jgi:hypothetical protein